MSEQSNQTGTWAEFPAGGSNPGLSLEEVGRVSLELQKGRWDCSWEQEGCPENSSLPSLSPNRTSSPSSPSSGQIPKEPPLTLFS